MDPATIRRAVLTGIRPLARDTVHYTFELDAPIQFEAGQFVNLVIPGASAVSGGSLSEPEQAIPPSRAASRIERSYSMWNAPSPGGDNRLEFAIKLFAGGHASDYLRAAPVGTRLSIHGPYGHFVLRDDDAAPGRSADGEIERSPFTTHWFLATTTGLAPFHSMLQGAARNRDPRPFRLLFGCREEADVFALAELDALRDQLDFAYKVCLSRPSPDTVRERGRITAHLPTPDPAARYYLCGNGAMIAEAREQLKAAGVDRKRIHYEKYW